MVNCLNVAQDGTMHYSAFGKSRVITERKKWEMLFEHQLRSLEVKAWQCGFKFNPGRKWRSDFAWPEAMLLVEIEGGIWMPRGGAHSHPINILRDIEKYNSAAELGYRVFRFVGHKLKDLEAVNLVLRLVGKGNR